MVRVRLFSYVVARDYGFAPNPFYGFCTLATCKPQIRKTACVGDWIIGTGSKIRGRENRIVFAMRVTEVLTFSEYWSDARFQQKKPYLIGSRKQRYGDNIYFQDRITGKWYQENSHHSRSDGQPNLKNVVHDTQVNQVLVSTDFMYWGGTAPMIPDALCHDLCKKGPGHKSNFAEGFAEQVVAWIRSQNDAGFAGAPLDWG